MLSEETEHSSKKKEKKNFTANDFCIYSRFQCRSLQKDAQENLGFLNVKEWYNLQKNKYVFCLKEKMFSLVGSQQRNS